MTKKRVYTKEQQARIKMYDQLDVEFKACQAKIRKLKTYSSKLFAVTCCPKLVYLEHRKFGYVFGYEVKVQWKVNVLNYYWEMFSTKEKAEKFALKEKAAYKKKQKSIQDAVKKVSIEDNELKDVPVPDGYKLVLVKK